MTKTAQISTPAQGPRIFAALLLLVATTTGCGGGLRDIYPPPPSPVALEAYVRARIFREQARFDEALGAIDAALAADDEHATLRIERADLLRLAGRPDEALVVLNDVLADEPTDTHALFVRAETWEAVGATTSAVADLDALLSLDPGHENGAFARARLSLAAGDPAYAAAVLDQLVASRPRLARAWLARANLAFETADFPAAIAAYEAFARLDQRSELAWVRLAHAYAAEGDAAGQEDALARCVEERPSSLACKVDFIKTVIEHPEPSALDKSGAAALEDRLDTLLLCVSHDARLLDAELLVELSVRVLATQPPGISDPFIESVLMRRPDLSDLALRLGIARERRGEYRAALRAFDMVDPQSGHRGEASLRAAQALLSMNRAADAEQRAAEAIDAAPFAESGYAVRAEALAVLGRRADALAVLDAGMESCASSPGLWTALGRVHELTGDTPQAVNSYQHALDAPAAATELDTLPQGTDPGVRRARLALARLLVSERRFDDAEGHLAQLEDETVERPAERASLLELRGRIALARGDADGSITLLEEATALRPDDIEALLMLGEARHARGDIDGAAAALHRALAVAGTKSQREAIAARLAALPDDVAHAMPAPDGQ